MSMTEQFITHVSDAYRRQPAPLETLPAVLVSACVEVLPVVGAGISLTLDELRVPLGASDEQVAAAERLQTTLGEGPCLSAMRAGEPVSFDEAAMAERWPVFHGQVLSATPFRSIVSVPIRSAGACVGALDLYRADSDLMPMSELSELSSGIGAQISYLLFDAPTKAFDFGITMPVWLSNATVTDRMNVWVAIGMLMEHAELTNTTALAVLRAYAFGHDQSLDETAGRLVDGSLKPVSLVG